MDVRRAWHRRLARQLGHPSGPFGRVVTRWLDRDNAATIAAAVDLLGIEPGQTVADVGFGGGVGLGLLLERVGSGGHVLGFDISDTAIGRALTSRREAVAAGRLTLRQAPMQALPAADASIDGIITTNTVYFVADLPAALSELARVLRPQGRLVLGHGDPAWMRQQPVTGHGFTIREIDEVVATLDAAGLPVIAQERVAASQSGVHLLLAERRLGPG